MRTLFAAAAIAASTISACESSGDRPPAAAIAQFCPAVTEDRRWNDMKSDTTASGFHVSAKNEPPQLPAAFDPAGLHGEFNFVVVATAGVPSADTIRRGRLWLAPTDTVHRFIRCDDGSRCGKPGVEFTQFGGLDSAFSFPGLQSIVTPLVSRIQADPGVVALFDSSERQLMLILGNPYLRWTDAGVFLQVFQADAGGFTGRWTDGGLALVPGQTGEPTRPQGHFCAWRVPG